MIRILQINMHRQLNELVAQFAAEIKADLKLTASNSVIGTPFMASRLRVLAQGQGNWCLEIFLAFT